MEIKEKLKLLKSELSANSRGKVIETIVVYAEANEKEFTTFYKNKQNKERDK